MTALTLDTHLGAVDALEFGPRSSQVDLVLCIQGKSPNTDVVTEWHPLARLLQDKSIRVVVPNLHSNERTRPGTISQEDFDRFVLGALTQLKVKTLLCLCGKSWGGGRCVAFLAEHPTAANSLMLIAPSLKETTAGMVSDVAQKRTLLAWAWDDTVVPIAAAQPLLEAFGHPGGDDVPGTASAAPSTVEHGLLTWITVDVGDHRIVPEYLPALVKWITPAPPPCKMCAKLAALPADCASLGDAGLQAAAAAARAAAGVLWEDSFWLVMHKRPPCGVVGHLQLISKRHFQGPSTFSNAEATIFGVTLRRCERALEQATGCDRVYTAALGSPKSGGHFHAHMMPVFDDKPPKEVTGTPFDIFLQEKLAADGVEGAAADEAECARVAEAWRFAMHDPRGPPNLP